MNYINYCDQMKRAYAFKQRLCEDANSRGEGVLSYGRICIAAVTSGLYHKNDEFVIDGKRALKEVDSDVALLVWRGAIKQVDMEHYQIEAV